MPIDAYLESGFEGFDDKFTDPSDALDAALVRKETENRVRSALASLPRDQRVKGAHCSIEKNKPDIHEGRNEVYNDQGTLHESGLEPGKEIDRRSDCDQYFDSGYNSAIMPRVPVGDRAMKAVLEEWEEMPMPIIVVEEEITGSV